MFSNIRQSLSAREAFDLVQSELQEVEREISVESVASVEALTILAASIYPALKLPEPSRSVLSPFVWFSKRRRAG